MRNLLYFSAILFLCRPTRFYNYFKTFFHCPFWLNTLTCYLQRFYKPPTYIENIVHCTITPLNHQNNLKRPRNVFADQIIKSWNVPLRAEKLSNSRKLQTFGPRCPQQVNNELRLQYQELGLLRSSTFLLSTAINPTEVEETISYKVYLWIFTDKFRKLGEKSRDSLFLEWFCY